MEGMNQMENCTKFKGAPVCVAGNFVKPGMKAPDFLLSTGDLKDFSLAQAGGKKVLMNIFPSLDTSVCALSVRRFNRLAAEIENAVVLCVSRDLPFAQSRFCAAEGIENVVMLSDFRYKSAFGEDYGVVMKDGPLGGLFARSVVIIGTDGNIAYSAMNGEITEEPDYDAALKALAD